MTRLTNKVAIITGAGSGMGEEALYLPKKAMVVATDINEAAVQAVVKEIEAAGGQATAYAHNVVSEEEWIKVVEGAVATYGKVDVLVNNAEFPLQLDCWIRPLNNGIKS